MILNTHDDPETALGFQHQDILEDRCESLQRQNNGGLGGKGPSPVRMSKSMKTSRTRGSTRSGGFHTENG